MKIPRIAIAFLLIFSLKDALPAAAEVTLSLEELTQALDKALRNRHVVAQRHEAAVDSLRAMLDRAGGPDSILDAYDRLIDEFEFANVDSVIACCQRAVVLAETSGIPARAQHFKLRQASWLPAKSMVREGVLALRAENARGILPENRQLYLESGARLYLSTASFYPNSAISEDYRRKGLAFLDSLAAEGFAGPAVAKLIAGIRQLDSDDLTMAKASFMELLETPGVTDYERSRGAMLLASVYKKQGNMREAQFYYTLAALHDTARGDASGGALEQLGHLLYTHGDDIDRAYNYLYIALEEALRAGINVDAMSIASIMPSVSDDFQRGRSQMLFLLVIVSVCLFVSLVVLAIAFGALKRDMKRLDTLSRQLSQSVELKEQAVSNFLRLCVSYVERLEDFTRLARRKISAGQVDDLYNQLRSGKFFDEGNEMIGRLFDESFLRMFPGFVDEVNRLLRPDKRIAVTDSESLTTELRILALMRLGVKDTQMVARILGLSLNTIYTYRNRMRVNAIDRETFEENVMKIGHLE